jgi:hypothetical protein
MNKVLLKILGNTLSASLGVGLVLTSHLSQAAIYDRNGNKLPDAEVNSDKVNWKLLRASENKKYNGVGLLESVTKVCTAFFVNTRGNPNAPAYAITNGHCYNGVAGFIGEKEIIVNRPSDMIFKLNYFVNSESRVRSVRVKRTVYATMKNTDLAILELNTTFKQLVKEGFTPLIIDNALVKAGEPVEAIGVPLEGVKPSLSFLHKAICQIGESVKIREDVYNFDSSVRNRCSIVGGMSGSPMISLKTNRVVAIVNTGVNDEALNQKECSLNRPCEISRNGRVATLPNENYAQRVSNIPSCFNKNGIFSLKLRSCRLEKP